MSKLKRKLERLKWFVYRWQRMVHPQEEMHRVKEFIQNNILDRLHKKTDYRLGAIQNALPFINRSLASTYPVTIHETYAVFQKQVALSNQEWRTDPKTGRTSAITFKGNINQKDILVAGENRYVYELNRLHPLPALALDAANGNEASLKKIESIVKSWQEENPYLQSINWRSGIEAGIRSTNLVVVRLILQNISTATNLNNQIDLLLSYHYTFLRKHLSLYSSANNHLLKELLGLIVISAVYAFESHLNELSYYFSYYQNELLKQTYADGGSKEQTVHYHAAVLNASFLALHFAVANGMQPRVDFLNRIQSMCIFLDETTLGGQSESLFGDKDDSNIIYDVFDENFNLYQSLLTTGRRIFPEVHYTYYKEYSTDLVNTLLYDKLQYTASTSEVLNNKTYTFFPDSGYFIFKQLPANSKLFFDVGAMGFGPIAAHGHSDSLHFTLWVDGEPFIVDSGTYQYNPHYQKWREYFRGVKAHNTIAVNQQNHSKSLGPMLWGKLPEISLLKFGEAENWGTFCEAQHSAFSNPRGRVSHKRSIRYENEQVVVVDSLAGQGQYQADFYLHFHPAITPVLTGNELLLRKGETQIKLVNDAFKQAKLVIGDENEPLGWYSRKFDQLEKTYALVVSMDTKEKTELTTKIIFVG